MALCAALLGVVVALTAAEIAARSFFAASSPPVVELTVILSAVMYFAGYLVLLHRDQDVAVDYVYKRFPPAVRRVVDLLTWLAIASFFVLVIARAQDLMRVMSFARHPTFGVSQSWTVLPIVFGSAGCLWIALHRSLLALAALLARR